MGEIQHLTIGGRPATVAFMTSFDGTVVELADASVAIARFDDGGVAYYHLKDDLRGAGGAGSGNFGHAGRPGMESGSGPSGFPPDNMPREKDTIFSEKAWEDAKADYQKFEDQDQRIGSITFDYQSRTYEEINQSFHEGKATPEAKELNDLINEYGDLDAPIITYRGTHLSHEMMAKIIVGKTIRLPGLQSTSVDVGEATRFGSTILEIKAIRGIAIGGSERELLLPHGNRYKVVGRKMLDVDSTVGHSTLVERKRIEVIQLEQK